MKTNLFLTRVLFIFALFIGAAKVAIAQTSISVKETNKFYSYKASYDSTKTDKVQGYLDEKLKHASDISFKRTKIDANVTLDGGINFYIHNAPGELEMKFEKKKNSSSDFEIFKKMCDGLKTVMNDN